MGERKSHLKSRWGCIQCKARRVKCDEQQPACANCRRREEQCSYSCRNPTPASASPPEPSASAGASERLDGQQQQQQQVHHLRQLELMHHYTSDTYATLCMRPTGPTIQQLELPKLAFQHAFLLDSVFAIASLHLAYLRPHEARARVADAVRYQTQAIAATRQCVLKLEASECRAMYHCSTQLGVIALAFRAVASDSPDVPSPSETLRQLSQHWRGTFSILMASKNMMSQKDFEMFFKVPTWAMKPDRTPTLKLDSFLDLLTAKAKASPDAKQVVVPFGLGLSMEKEASTSCLVAIAKLQILFQLCQPEPSRILGWLVEVPQVFWDLVSERVPLACAAVLLYSVTYQNLEDHWWALGIRQQIAAELSPIVTAGDPDFTDLVAWVQSADWHNVND